MQSHGCCCCCPFTIPAPSSRPRGNRRRIGRPSPQLRAKRSCPSWASKSMSWRTRSSTRMIGRSAMGVDSLDHVPVGGDDQRQHVVVDTFRLGDGGQRRLVRPVSESSTTAEPSGRSWRTGTRPSHSSACQAKWRAWRARRSLAPAGVMRGTQATEHGRELQFERPGALDAIRPLDDPDLRRHPAHGVSLSRARVVGWHRTARPELRHHDPRHDRDRAQPAARHRAVRR